MSSKEITDFGDEFESCHDFLSVEFKFDPVCGVDPAFQGAVVERLQGLAYTYGIGVRSTIRWSAGRLDLWWRPKFSMVARLECDAQAYEELIVYSKQALDGLAEQGAIVHRHGPLDRPSSGQWDDDALLLSTSVRFDWFGNLLMRSDQTSTATGKAAGEDREGYRVFKALLDRSRAVAAMVFGGRCS